MKNGSLNNITCSITAVVIPSGGRQENGPGDAHTPVSNVAVQGDWLRPQERGVE